MKIFAKEIKFKKGDKVEWKDGNETVHAIILSEPNYDNRTVKVKMISGDGAGKNDEASIDNLKKSTAGVFKPQDGDVYIYEGRKGKKFKVKVVDSEIITDNGRDEVLVEFPKGDEGYVALEFLTKKLTPKTAGKVRKFKTYKAWKSAVKKLDPQAKFTGDEDIDQAFKKDWYDAEWDGESGEIRQIGTKSIAVALWYDVIDRTKMKKEFKDQLEDINDLNVPGSQIEKIEIDKFKKLMLSYLDKIINSKYHAKQIAGLEADIQAHANNKALVNKLKKAIGVIEKEYRGYVDLVDMIKSANDKSIWNAISQFKKVMWVD